MPGLFSENPNDPPGKPAGFASDLKPPELQDAGDDDEAEQDTVDADDPEVEQVDA